MLKVMQDEQKRLASIHTDQMLAESGADNSINLIMKANDHRSSRITRKVGGGAGDNATDTANNSFSEVNQVSENLKNELMESYRSSNTHKSRSVLE